MDTKPRHAPPLPATEHEDTPRLEKELWGRTGGGELSALRAEKLGADGQTEGHDEITAAETPEATRKLSDPTIAPQAGKKPA